MTIKRETISDLIGKFRATGSVQTTDEERRALARELQDVVAALQATGHSGLAVHAQRARIARMDHVDEHLDSILGIMYDEGMTEV